MKTSDAGGPQARLRPPEANRRARVGIQVRVRVAIRASHHSAHAPARRARDDDARGGGAGLPRWTEEYSRRRFLARVGRIERDPVAPPRGRKRPFATRISPAGPPPPPPPTPPPPPP